MTDGPMLPSPFPESTEKATPENLVVDSERAKEIVRSLESYRHEAEEARQNGLNPRDAKWKENLDLYWGRYDFSYKQNWQAKEYLPEVSQYVDRFAAALKDAVLSLPDGFYDVIDPADRENDIASAIKDVTDVWLSRSGRNMNGQILPFSFVFEEQMKMGAIMACSSVVTWKNDVPGGRVAIESVNPAYVWLDHTYRNLYRIRRTEIDRHELKRLAKMEDSSGRSVYNLPEIERLADALIYEDQLWRERSSGTGVDMSSYRRPIVVDEYLATVIDAQGDVIVENGLMVVANEQFLIRGPEPNPFWHERDWLVYAPLIQAPMSVYGRSYMEDFGSVATTFNELTNMLIDAIHTSSMNAFAIVPTMLMDPTQINEGLRPNMMFLLADGENAADFAQKLELGTVPPSSFQMWQALKNELSEGASMNELGIGQFAPNARTSATEIMEAKQGSSALIRSVAQTVEMAFLDPILDLTWKTGLQHMSADDITIERALGPDRAEMIYANRKDFVKRPITFQARGISQLIQRSATMQDMINLLGIIAQSDVLMKAFLDRVSTEKLMMKLFELSGIDLSRLEMGERERMMKQVQEQLAVAQQNVQNAPEASPEAAQEMGDVAQSMGVAQ